MIRGIQRQTCFVLHEYDRKACREDKKRTIERYHSKKYVFIAQNMYLSIE